MPTKLTSEVITAAIEGFEAQKTRLDAQIGELKAMLSGVAVTPAAAPSGGKRPRKKMSAAGRARIAEAQRKRWAESRKTAPAAAGPAAKPKRKLSAAGRKAIIAAVKKRWAAKKAAAESA